MSERAARAALEADVRVLLQEHMGVSQYDEGVVPALAECAVRTAAQILNDAHAYAAASAGGGAAVMTAAHVRLATHTTRPSLQDEVRQAVLRKGAVRMQEQQQKQQQQLLMQQRNHKTGVDEDAAAMLEAVTAARTVLKIAPQEQHYLLPPPGEDGFFVEEEEAMMADGEHQRPPVTTLNRNISLASTLPSAAQRASRERTRKEAEQRHKDYSQQQRRREAEQARKYGHGQAAPSALPAGQHPKVALSLAGPTVAGTANGDSGGAKATNTNHIRKRRIAGKRKAVDLSSAADLLQAFEYGGDDNDDDTGGASR